MYGVPGGVFSSINSFSSDKISGVKGPDNSLKLARLPKELFRIELLNILKLVYSSQPSKKGKIKSNLREPPAIPNSNVSVTVSVDVLIVSLTSGILS